MKTLFKYLGLIAASTLAAAPLAHAETTAFYAISNKADGNTVVGYRNKGDNRFELMGEYKTGGAGTGDLEIPALVKDDTHPLLNGDDPLISANSLAATADGMKMIAVNPGDSTISLMKVGADDGLTAVGTAPTTDRFPVSVAIHGDIAVVASVGENNGAGSIGAFRLSEGGVSAIEGSRRDLKARPSTIAFAQGGAFVIVNELVTGKIKVFSHTDGVLSEAPVSVIDSPRDDAARFQAIPVGFVVHGDTVLMSEARFLTPDFKLREEKGVVPQSPLYSWQTSSLSTYKIGNDGALSLVAGDVLTGDAVEGGEIANCWVAVSSDGETLWAANALSSSISSFRIRENGSASLVNARAFKEPSEMIFFSDLAVDSASKLLFQLVGNRGEVMIFDIAENGDLSLRQTLGGLPKLGAYGLVLR